MSVRVISVVLTMLMLSVCILRAQASTFAYPIDEGAWRVDSSVFECRLTHRVPFYGNAIFAHRAGENSHFFLSPASERLKTGKASLTIEPPVWKHSSKSQDLGYVSVKQSPQPINLGRLDTERLLSELLEGMELVFTRKPWYGARESTKIRVAPIGFRQAYTQYQQCLASLLPVNFDQIKKTAVYFGSNRHEQITAADQKRLDHIVLYAKADPSVKEFYIDGHTDKVGTRKDNLVLAEQRAQTVTQYLVNKGLDEEKIIVRWHGERYPVATNATVNGRAKNRRVTIRLERAELMKKAMKKTMNKDMEQAMKQDMKGDKPSM